MERLAGLLKAPAGRAAEAWRELVRDCYAAHDFVVLGCVLRFFPEADLTAVCLDYLDTDLVRLLWYVFRMPPEDRIEMGSRPPFGGGRLHRGAHRRHHDHARPGQGPQCRAHRRRSRRAHHRAGLTSPREQLRA